MTAIQKQAAEEYEIQVKLHVNEQLYKKGILSRELYEQARKMIRKNHR